jgi:hypothetical protein
LMSQFIPEGIIKAYCPTSDFSKINRKFLWGVYGGTNAD